MGKQKSNSSKKININAKNTLQYIQVFNGILELTDKELLVLSMFIDYGDHNNLCTVDTKIRVAKEIGIEDYNTLNNYVKRLKDKKAIFQGVLNGRTVYKPAAFLIPNNNVVIQINKV